MASIDCPFRKADELLASLDPSLKIRIVDFHAELTSEKVAMGWYLDGRATAMIGTHTHVPTADARVLPGGLAYQTDAGMTGPYDSVIGVEKDIILRRFLSWGCRPHGSGAPGDRIAWSRHRCRRGDRQGNVYPPHPLHQVAFQKSEELKHGI